MSGEVPVCEWAGQLSRGGQQLVWVGPSRWEGPRLPGGLLVWGWIWVGGLCTLPQGPFLVTEEDRGWRRSCERSPAGQRRESRGCYLGLLFVEDTSS